MEILQRCRNPLVIQLLVICIVFAATADTVQTRASSGE